MLRDSESHHPELTVSPVSDVKAGALIWKECSPGTQHGDRAGLGRRRDS